VPKLLAGTACCFLAALAASGAVATTPSALPPPVLGKSANIARVSGTVLVRVRGSKTFVVLTAPRQIPLGSELDTTNGRVRLTFATGYGGTEHADWWQGRFVIGQSKTGKHVATQALSGPLACPKKVFESAGRRRIWGKGKGHFRSSGNAASAAVRGTWWLTEDTCAGTLVRVKTGTVDVFDFAKRKHVLLHAGQSYFARKG
jgi:hypothetical protein